MSKSYPNYDRCHTKAVDDKSCKCLMDECNALCPQKALNFGIVLCEHPDNYKFAIDDSNDEKRHAH